MIKQFFFLVIFFFIFAVSVNSSLNCPSNADALDEFKVISSAALLEFLGDPDNSKLSSNEVSDISSFYDKYKDNWGNADCNEIGTISGSTIKVIIEKYTGVIDTRLNCRVENPEWSIGQTFEGTEVTLTVDAPKCNDGATVNFVVKERDFTKDDDGVIKNPDNAAVLNQKATTTWKAEWQRDEEQTPSGPKNDEPPEYYFTASLGSSSVKSGVLTVTKCVDADRDGYSSVTCGGNDCKDNDASIHPNVRELCDTKDNNCNLAADEGGVCGYDLAKRGSFSVGSIIPTKDTCIGDPDLDLFSTYLRSPALSNSSSSWSESLGKYDFAPNGIIDLSDLFSLIDHLQGADSDKDNYDTTTCHRDCKDNDKLVNPGAAELCDGKDNNCNAVIDEVVKATYYYDKDRDGYGTSKSSSLCDADTDVECVDSFGGACYSATRGNDCNDADRNINPGASEVCDGKDNNCDGRIDYASSANDLDNSCGTDVLVATGNTRSVSVNYACQQIEQKEWRDVDYFCSEGSGCSNRVISTTWYSTGVTNNVNEGAICRGNFCSGSSTLNYNFRCNNGQCTGASSSCDTADYCSGSYRYFGGYCSKGACSFNSEYCQLGCNNGKCNQDPCAGVTCNNVCAAGQIGIGGTCSNGKCYYNWDYCQSGCADDTQCSSPPVNKCAGVTCQPYCNGNYKINTRCDSSNGGCVYSSSEYCQYGCESGQCKPKPQQSCSCRYQDQCLQNWQCTTIGGANYLCYGGRLYKGYQNQCR